MAFGIASNELNGTDEISPRLKKRPFGFGLVCLFFSSMHNEMLDSFVFASSSTKMIHFVCNVMVIYSSIKASHFETNYTFSSMHFK